MPTFQCLIKATKGSSISYFHATVQEDGFTYFNDKTFYRIETPANLVSDLEAGSIITITGGIQYWYVKRDIWVYSSFFDTLELEKPEDFDKQVVQDAVNIVNDRVNTTGSMAIGTNGQVLYDLWNDVFNIAADLNSQSISVRYPTARSIYTTWNGFPPITL